MRRRAALLVGSLVATAALTACAGEETSAPSRGLQVRPVLGAADGLACDALGDRAVADLERPGNAPAEEDVEACALDGVGYRLGEAAVDGGVVSVELRAATDSYLVEIALDDDAAQAMSDAASSDSQVALVADGVVISAPMIAGVVGGSLQVSGPWNGSQAEEIAALLRG
jgi:preprotein translocase subunit SecD